MLMAVMMVAVCAAAAAAVGMPALLLAVLVFSVRPSMAIIPIRSIVFFRTRRPRCSIVLLRPDVRSTASAACMHPRSQGRAAHEYTRQLRGVGAVLDGAAHKLQQDVAPAV